MSRLNPARLVAATGLTLGTTAVTLLLAAPVASAALPGPTAPAGVVGGSTFIVSGTGCTPAELFFEPFVAVSTDAANAPIVIAQPAAGGAWTATLSFPASTTGVRTITATCNQSYNGTEQGDRVQAYPATAVTVMAGTSTAPNVPPVQDEQPPGALLGVAANTPGTTAVRTGATTGPTSAPGEKVVKVIAGFQPFEEVTLVMHSTPRTLGTFRANAQGVLTVEFTLPAGTPVGDHTLVYDGTVTYYQEALKVTRALRSASASRLPNTGADITVPLALGGALVIAGTGVLVASRRRPGATQA